MLLSGMLMGFTWQMQGTAGNGITQPVAGSVLAGVVTVTGTAVDPNYLRYELAFRALDTAVGTEATWIVFAEGDQPVVNGTLAVWDTTVGRAINAPVFPDGRYQLRLRVVRTDYNYTEYIITDLQIANSVATPTPTGTATPATNATPSAGGTPLFLQLTPIPSLTPFPTPTSLPMPVNDPTLAPEGATAVSDEAGGLLGQLATIDTGRIGRAFWGGVRLAAYAFGLFCVYLLLRAVGRWLWRVLWQQVQRRRD